MARIMITAVNLNYADGNDEYEILPAAHKALTRLGYQLKTPLQPETDNA